MCNHKGVDVHEDCIGSSVIVPHDIHNIAKQLHDYLSRGKKEKKKFVIEKIMMIQIWLSKRS